MAEPSPLIDINVGGQIFTTKLKTIAKFPDSVLGRKAAYFLANSKFDSSDIDSQGRLFLDRDPKIFSHVLQYLREENSTDIKKGADLSPTQDFEEGQTCKWLHHLPKYEQQRFADECEHFHLSLPSFFADSFPEFQRSHPHFNRCVSDNEIYRSEMRNKSIRRSHSGPKYISLGYRATYEVTRDAFSNDKFRRITRITVCGSASAAKEVFDDDINDSRDPDRQPAGGYTSRYYLKHNHLEKAFESLCAKGFHMVASTSSGSKTLTSQADEYKQWTAYVDYVFCHP